MILLKSKSFLLWDMADLMALPDLLLAALFGVVLSLLYMKRALRPAGGRRLAVLLPVMTLTTALIGSVIAVSASLAIGMVGTLSVVRFRQRLESVDQLIFLFLALAIGLACGTQQVLLAAFSLLVVIPVFLIADRMASRRGTRVHLHLRGSGDIGSTLLHYLPPNVGRRALRHHRHEAGSQTWDLDFRIASFDEAGRMLAALRKAHPEAEISLRSI